jgi:hypothetical protein
MVCQTHSGGKMINCTASTTVPQTPFEILKTSWPKRKTLQSPRPCLEVGRSMPHTTPGPLDLNACIVSGIAKKISSECKTPNEKKRLRASGTTQSLVRACISADENEVDLQVGSHHHRTMCDGELPCNSA